MCPICVWKYASHALLKSYPVPIKSVSLSLMTLRIECPACKQEVPFTKPITYNPAVFTTKDLYGIMEIWGERICKDHEVKKTYRKQVHDLSSEVTRQGLMIHKFRMINKHRRFQQKSYKMLEEELEIKYKPETEEERQNNNTTRIPLTIRQPVIN